MLPESYRQQYQTFQQVLEQLANQTSQLEPDKAALRLEVLQVQRLFQKEIQSLDLEILDAALAHRSHALQVEIDKQLRLLNIEVLSWQAARQPATQAQRSKQVGDRLNTLIAYCKELAA